jgi:hypothetical protein
MADSDLTTEVWVPIPDFPNYRISNLGRIISFARRREGKFLKLVLHDDGYYGVSLCRDARVYTWRVNRLVLIAFRGIDPERPLSNHKNGNKLDNRLDNLEWVTDAENKEHARLTGLLKLGDRHWTRRFPEKIRRGASNSHAKLTDEQVLEIRRQAGTRMGIEIAKDFDVSASLICDIIHGRVWRHI